MDGEFMIKYVIKRLLLALLIVVGVSVIIYVLVRMMPMDFVDRQFQSQLSQGTITQKDLDEIKDLYGLRVRYDVYLNQAEPEYRKENGQLVIVEEKDKDGNIVKMPIWENENLFNWAPNYKRDKDGNLKLDKNGNPIDRNKDVFLGIFHWDNWDAEAGEDSLTGGQKAICKVISFVEGYAKWLGNALKGDLGQSFKYADRVTAVIGQHMWISFAISLIAMVLQFVIAIPLGIQAATHQYGALDYTVTVLAMMGISLPTFFLGALMLSLFSLNLGWFPYQGLHDASLIDPDFFTQFLDTAWHLILPIVCLVILSIGGLMRYTRTNMLEVLNADYIRTARAKGCSEKSVIYRHAFRNTLIPVVTMLAGIIPSLFGGAMITEQVFSLPGIGNQAYQALVVGDVPFVMGYNLFLAILSVLGTLLSDLMYAVVDPRVKITK